MTQNTNTSSTQSRPAIRSTVSCSSSKRPLRRLALACSVLLAAGLPVAAQADECPNAAYRTGPSANLPDCRAYEMVTPPDEPNEMASGNGFETAVTDNGDHFLYANESGSLSDTPVFTGVVRADRGTQGWTNHSPLPRPSTFGAYPTWALYFSNTDLSTVVLTSRAYDPADVDEPLTADEDIYRFDTSGGETFMSPNEIDPADGGDQKELLAASEDGRSIVFTDSRDPLLPIDIARASDQKLYEFRDGALRSAGVDEEGHLLAIGNTVLGGTRIDNGTNLAFNAYSRDGSKLFFTADLEPYDPTPQRPGLYVRVDGTHVYAIPGSPAGANASSIYLGATPDGSKAFFTTPLALTPDDTDTSNDLYEYDVASHAVTRLTPGANAGVLPRAVWTSDDGSRVYFTATGRLILGRGSASGPKTFLYDHGQIKFVADAELIGPGASTGGPQCGPTRVTPDGRFLLAVTSAALTRDDTDGGATDVYRYDANSGQTILISSSSFDRSSPNDRTLIQPDSPGSGQPGCYGIFDHLTHVISDNGQFVFFSTTAALVPEDVNGRRDVYEWDARTGQVSLVTSGKDSYDSQFLDSTPRGNDVLFSTREQLLQVDGNAQSDVYDARIGGGFLSRQSPVCRESGCQGRESIAPPFTTPGSLALVADHGHDMGRHHKALVLRRLSATALKRLLDTGTTAVTVVAAVDGAVVLRATLSLKGHAFLAGRVVSHGRTGKPISLRLTLTGSARRFLARHHQARLVLVTRQNGVDVSAVYTIREKRGINR